MGLIGNILWFIFGGLLMGLGWWLAGLLAAITIVGIPWAKACFVIGQFAFFPFGKEAVSRKDLTHKDDIGTGVLGLIAYFSDRGRLFQTDRGRRFSAIVDAQGCAQARN